MATLFAVGRFDDPHILRVCQYLETYGVNAVLAPSWAQDPAAFLPVTWSLESGWTFPRHSAFWLRNKHRVGAITSSEKQQEWWSFSSTLELLHTAAHQGALLFNRSRHLAASDSKVAQLALARECGFKVPRTLISNDKDRIIPFLRECGECIVKPICSLGLPPIGDDLSTTRLLSTLAVTAEDIASYPDAALQIAPSIFQERVPKDHELRVIAFNDSSVTLKLHSQKHKFTELDWRAGEPLVECTLTDTPAEIIEPIRRFLNVSGLNTTVFDFAVTPDGEIVFFESNPSGQWARMDENNGFAISKMFAREMAMEIERTFGG